MLRKYIFVALMIFSSVSSVSCGADKEVEIQEKQEVVSAVVPTEDGLKSRAGDRWEALIKRDFNQAYTYMSPAYRKLYSFEQYRSGFGDSVVWDSMDIESIKLDGEAAEVKLELFYRLSAAPGSGSSFSEDLGLISKNIVERWLWDGETWWFVE